MFTAFVSKCDWTKGATTIARSSSIHFVRFFFKMFFFAMPEIFMHMILIFIAIPFSIVAVVTRYAIYADLAKAFLVVVFLHAQRCQCTSMVFHQVANGGVKSSGSLLKQDVRWVVLSSSLVGRCQHQALTFLRSSFPLCGSWDQQRTIGLLVYMRSGDHPCFKMQWNKGLVSLLDWDYQLFSFPFFLLSFCICGFIL